MTTGSDLRDVEGGCHCGNIRYTFRLPAREIPIRVRACSCSFCVKHGGVYTSHPEAEINIRIKDPDAIERYRFGTKTADFLICRQCGVVPVVTSWIDDVCFAVVNVNTFENIDRAELDSSTTDFDGEGTGERLARRQRNWVPVVAVDPPF